MPRQPDVPSVPVPARSAILAWFDERGRSFPFRDVRDPYAILVSETMAQQTQIARATEAWERFIARFPTFAALATAPAADVLRQWRGLGYNRRAVNLQRAARAVVEEHGGRLPEDVDALRRLPGIGPYTARAVAALAFGRPVGAVDTNVRRVLGRLVRGGAATSPADLQEIADASVPSDRPGDWTHALMDLGATICRPSRPDCAACPARTWCAWAVGADADSSAPPTTTPARRDVRHPGPAFRSTSRWLRGRLLDRLREGEGSAWVGVDWPVGDHGREAVEDALAALARDGLAERHPTEPHLARLPVA